jgi:phosphatidylethanolamine/phosphatidyl-N-methylethanolamine N-methyltransferase
MPPSRTRAKGRIEHRLADEARFLRTWLDKPKLMGAVSPSGRFLARMMASHVDPDGTDPIVELGPGTGPITEALIQRGVDPARLTLVEYDRAFCRLLARRFPGVRVVQGDAYALSKTLKGVIGEQIGTIVSSLPLLTKPESQRLALLDDAFALMTPGGRFVQFTYGRASPVPREGLASTFHAHVSPLVWLNLPPARVWVYRRAGAFDTLEAAMRRERPDLFDRLRFHTERVQQDLKREFFAAKARLRLRAGADAHDLAHSAPAPIPRMTPESSHIRHP